MNNFEKKLELLKNSNENELISKSYDFVDEVESEFGYKKELLKPLFILFEERSEDDFGMPGPLVGYIEQVDGYETELLNSLDRKPVTQNLVMVKRILNSGSAESKTFSDKIATIYSDMNTHPVIKNMIDNIIYDK